eukprot:jgi/Pico_ML_1/53660/g4169.t1
MQTQSVPGDGDDPEPLRTIRWIGNVREGDGNEYFTNEGYHDGRPHSFLVYTPARTAVVYARVSDDDEDVVEVAADPSVQPSPSTLDKASSILDDDEEEDDEQA